MHRAKAKFSAALKPEAEKDERDVEVSGLFRIARQAVKETRDTLKKARESAERLNAQASVCSRQLKAK